MPSITVCSLALLDSKIARLKPWGVISLLSPGSMIATPDTIDPARHLRLELHDIIAAMDGHTHPMETHAATLLNYVNDWDVSQPLLIHCWAGVSRSTASAFITACALNPQTSEREIATEIRACSPTATPNRMLVAHADDILQRGGRMVDAVDAIGRGEDCWEGVPFSIPASWVPR